jgi:hypothetical protein
MDFYKRIIAIFFFALFSLQTFAEVHLGHSEIETSPSSDSKAYYKSFVLSGSNFVDPTVKRIGIESSESINNNAFNHPDCVRLLVPFSILNQSLLSDFNNHKSEILTSVNLIFPFQYFW